jgi:hypothetical protein
VPSEMSWVVALGVLIVAYCGAYLMAQGLNASPPRREQISTGFRVALLVLVAAYLLMRIPFRGL